jgi:hypothetical protein
MHNLTRREAVLGGIGLLGLLSSGCNAADLSTPTPEPTVKPNPAKIIHLGDPIVTFPNGVVANFTELPIKVFPKSLDLISASSGYGIEAKTGQVGFYMLADSIRAENSPRNRAYMESMVVVMRERYKEQQGRNPLEEFSRLTSIRRLFKEHLDAVPLKEENLPILAHNFGPIIASDWAEFTHAEVRKRSKNLFTGERLSNEANGIITYMRPFQVPELTPDMYKKLKAA